MDVASKFSAPILLFILTLAFGFWLSRLGRPYNGILFNIHKLIALGTVVFAVVRISGTANIAGWPLIIMLIAAGLCVLALFASGALMSAGKLSYNFTLTTHRAALVLSVFVMGGTIYLLSAGW